jgi:hypothetical protein
MVDRQSFSIVSHVALSLLMRWSRSGAVTMVIAWCSGLNSILPSLNTGSSSSMIDTIRSRCDAVSALTACVLAGWRVVGIDGGVDEPLLLWLLLLLDLDCECSFLLRLFDSMV